MEFLSERPIEQLPRKGTRSRPGDSSHAPASSKSMEAFYSNHRKRKASTFNGRDFFLYAISTGR
jgi:hypothetical protein